jgi:RTX calcium-binding nonapeptide repeat (4 copies)
MRNKTPRNVVDLLEPRQMMSTTPAAPSVVEGWAITNGTQFRVAWKDNATNETGYQIRRTSFENGQIVTRNFNVGANRTSYIDTKVTQRVNYTYSVRAVNGTVRSAFKGFVEGYGRTGTPDLRSMLNFNTGLGQITFGLTGETPSGLINGVDTESVLVANGGKDGVRGGRTGRVVPETISLNVSYNIADDSETYRLSVTVSTRGLRDLTANLTGLRDSFRLNAPGMAVNVNALNGNDSIIVAGGVVTVRGDAGNDSINAEVFALSGSQFDSTKAVPMVVFGGEGNDTIIGAGARDTLWGEGGDDLFEPAESLPVIGGSSTPIGLVDGGPGRNRAIQNPGYTYQSIQTFV